MTTTPTDQIKRSVRFFAPTDMKGKWHAKRMITGEADCGRPVLLGEEFIEATKDSLSAGTQHPIVCGLCRKLNQNGYSSQRVR
jgi:hypothetical protein